MSALAGTTKDEQAFLLQSAGGEFILLDFPGFQVCVRSCWRLYTACISMCLSIRLALTRILCDIRLVSCRRGVIVTNVADSPQRLGY